MAAGGYLGAGADAVSFVFGKVATTFHDGSLGPAPGKCLLFHTAKAAKTTSATNMAPRRVLRFMLLSRHRAAGFSYEAFIREEATK